METLIVIVLIFAIIIIFVYYYNKKKEHLDNVNMKQLTGYTSIDDPYIKPVVMSNLLTEVECRKIIDYCIDSTLQDNSVFVNPVNKKYSQQFAISKYDPLVKPLVEELATSLIVPFENAEDCHVMKYIPNQFTKPHVDACCSAINDTCKEYLKTGGQRILTCIVYLSKDFTGGEIYFNNLDMKFEPKIGEGVIFYNVAQNINKCHPKATQSSLIVNKGEKWVIIIRFRESENKLQRKTI